MACSTNLATRAGCRTRCLLDQRRLPWLAVLLCAGLLGGCSGLGRSERPATVEERAARPSPSAVQKAPAGEAQIAAYTPPAQPRIERAAPNRAVEVLVARAEDQRRSGSLDAASVSLERALRIAPEDPVLWHRLAAVRAAQQRHDLVLQLAAKSNALAASGDHGLMAENWRLIAAARSALGDAPGASEARANAAALR